MFCICLNFIYIYKKREKVIHFSFWTNKICDILPTIFEYFISSTFYMCLQNQFQSILT